MITPENSNTIKTQGETRLNSRNGTINTRTGTYLQGYRYRHMTFDGLEGEQLSEMIESGRDEAEQVTTITRIRRRR